MKFNYLTLIGILCICISGCIPTKKLKYLQDLESDDNIVKEGELIPYNIDDYLLQINDIVDITITTSSVELNEMLQGLRIESQVRNIDGLTSGDIFFLNGYTLDNDGFVDLPLVGRLELQGMTLKDVKNAIEVEMEKYVNRDNFYVRVRLGGVSYSAIGEFRDPGKYTILQNRVTIFEAIANAGDMTALAIRDEILLVRQYPEGSKTFTLNLLSDEINESEFFFIRPNDLIYAQPMKRKSWGTGITFAQTLQLILAATTVVLLYINVTN